MLEVSRSCWLSFPFVVLFLFISRHFSVLMQMCNREGSEIVDAIMKVVGIKLKGQDGQVTHSQYVRVNLVDFEHPFFSRVWHGVHILDATSPILTERAKRRIKENNGSWPTSWFDPEKIKDQLEFSDLVVTVAGISNVSVDGLIKGFL